MTQSAQAVGFEYIIFSQHYSGWLQEREVMGSSAGCFNSHTHTHTHTNTHTRLFRRAAQMNIKIFSDCTRPMPYYSHPTALVIKLAKMEGDIIRS